jgi:hypothetical protein
MQGHDVASITSPHQNDAKKPSMCVRDCRTIDHILDTEHPEETLLLMFIF